MARAWMRLARPRLHPAPHSAPFCSLSSPGCSSPAPETGQRKTATRCARRTMSSMHQPPSCCPGTAPPAARRAQRRRRGAARAQATRAPGRCPHPSGAAGSARRGPETAPRRSPPPCAAGCGPLCRHSAQAWRAAMAAPATPHARRVHTGAGRHAPESTHAALLARASACGAGGRTPRRTWVGMVTKKLAATEEGRQARAPRAPPAALT